MSYFICTCITEDYPDPPFLRDIINEWSNIVSVVHYTEWVRVQEKAQMMHFLFIVTLNCKNMKFLGI